MAQEVVGSNPTTHPILPIPRTMGCRQAVRHQTLTLALVGSNPATPASFFDPLAQLVEHLTFNQVVRSSTLRRITIFSSADADLCAGVAELADAPDLGSGTARCESSSLSGSTKQMVAMAELVYALDCGSSFCGFESH